MVGVELGQVEHVLRGGTQVLVGARCLMHDQERVWRVPQSAHKPCEGLVEQTGGAVDDTWSVADQRRRYPDRRRKIERRVLLQKANLGAGAGFQALAHFASYHRRGGNQDLLHAGLL